MGPGRYLVAGASASLVGWLIRRAGGGGWDLPLSSLRLGLWHTQALTGSRLSSSVGTTSSTPAFSGRGCCSGVPLIRRIQAARVGPLASGTYPSVAMTEHDPSALLTFQPSVSPMIIESRAVSGVNVFGRSSGRGAYDLGVWLRGLSICVVCNRTVAIRTKDEVSRVSSHAPRHDVPLAMSDIVGGFEERVGTTSSRRCGALYYGWCLRIQPQGSIAATPCSARYEMANCRLALQLRCGPVGSLILDGLARHGRSAR